MILKKIKFYLHLFFYSALTIGLISTLFYSNILYVKAENSSITIGITIHKSTIRNEIESAEKSIKESDIALQSIDEIIEESRALGIIK